MGALFMCTISIGHLGHVMFKHSTNWIYVGSVDNDLPSCDTAIW